MTAPVFALPVYLASPYSDEDLDIQHWRAAEAAKAAAILARANVPVYAPIVHWHFIAHLHDLPTDAQSWKIQNRAFLEIASEVWVLKLSGFDRSIGVKWEVSVADELKIPVKLLSIINGNYHTFPRGNLV